MYVRLKGVNRVKKHLKDGSIQTYYYHRASGARLNGRFGSPEFVASFAKAEERLSAKPKGTFEALCRLYTTSPEFAQLAERSQAEYKRMLATAETRFKGLPIKALDDRRIKADFLGWRAEVVERSGLREGDNRLSAISALLTWSRENGRIDHNHLKGFKRLYRSDRSDKLWTQTETERFMAVAPYELQFAFIVAMHTGLRQGDILRLTWSAYDGEKLTVAVRKNRNRPGAGKVVTIPCTNALKRALDDAKRSSPLILTTKTHRAFTSRHFGNLWLKASKLAEVGDLHFHDLRGTAITLLAEAGCTIPQIASITGHSLRTVTDILGRSYLASTLTLARGAIATFENAAATEFANLLQTRKATNVTSA